MSDQRIMIVEDEHIIALDIKKHVMGFGYDVAGIHSSGESALAAMKDEHPDLVLMDIRLNGEMDGLETAQIIKTEHNIPVVMLTAYADDDTLDRAKLSQPFAYIIKPYEERELRTAIIISLYRHQMEQMVVQRERLFSTTLESIVDAVIVTDEAGRIDFLNSVACDLLGLDPANAVGTLLDDRVKFSERTPEIGTELAPKGEFNAEMADGRTVPVERTTTPLHGTDGQRSGWVWVLHDISRRIEYERIAGAQNERLRRSQKMEAIGRLTGGIAHDFNNLLTVIMGYSRLIVDELAEADVPGRDAIISDVEGIQKAAMRSAALTKQLLSFGRNQNVERQPTDLNEALTEVEPILRQLLKDNVSLTMDLTGGSSVVFADPSQLEQVIMNLVVNARDAMPEGGRLLITTEGKYVSLAEVIGRDEVEPGEFVVVTVSDSGSGMDPETVDRIFDPFFTTKESGKGTGLGLSTVYGIVTQSHGFVDVESRLGDGTTFTVSLPAYLDGSADVQMKTESARKDTGAETILLVEDDDAIRTLVSRLLRQKGYDVLSASNAGEALLEAENFTGTIHLLLSDIVMPLMSGVSLAIRLRETRPHIRVILMSGYPDSSLTDEERQKMGFHFLEKPVDPGTLTRHVRQILDE